MSTKNCAEIKLYFKFASSLATMHLLAFTFLISSTDPLHFLFSMLSDPIGTQQMREWARAPSNRGGPRCAATVS
ncbi:hypothetical protein F5888DRAFT_1741883 [Russula emetica]|nr:hypothetical protein F5888DRAFT_1741883 [Russula emetica]